MREAEVHIDAMIGPVEESFALLNKHELLLNTGNAERVDSLTYTWNNLNALVRLRKGLDNILYQAGVSAEVHLCVCVCAVFQVVQNQNTLVKIQPSMKADLLSAVESFQDELQNFCIEYNDRYTDQAQTEMMCVHAKVLFYYYYS